MTDSEDRQRVRDAVSETDLERRCAQCVVRNPRGLPEWCPHREKPCVLLEKDVQES